jgi:hypothetical protein
LAVLSAQPVHFLLEPTILISHMLEGHVVLPHGGDALIERSDGFERQPDKLTHRAIEIVEQSLTLSWKKKESRQEESKHS